MSASAPARRYHQVARVAATEQTRQRLVAAFAAALEARWIEEITLDDVAATAGTTRQTAIRLFGGKDGLLAACCDRLGEEVRGRRRLPAGAGPRAVARAVVQDYEASGDLVLRLLAQEGRHAPLGAMLDAGRLGHRRWLAEAFAAVLAGRAAAEREALLDQFVVATDVFTWKLLRRDRRRGAAEVEALMAGLMQGVIQEGKPRDG
jgi:AcrR family transcriptional regulator